MRRTLPLLVVGLLYVACLIGATWPWVGRLDQELPALSPAVVRDLADFEQRNLWRAREVGVYGTPSFHQPTAAAAGLNAPQRLPFFVYAIARSGGLNPVAAYNSAWLVGFLGIGIGAFALARHICGHVGASALAGGMVMLGASARLRGAGHLEMLYFGVVPLALLFWIRWWEQATTGRWILALLGLILVALTALQHAVLAGFLVLLWSVGGVLTAWRQGKALRAWVGPRVLMTCVALGGLACATMWLHGEEIRALDGRAGPSGTMAEYQSMGAPTWSFLLPAAGSRLAPLLEFDPFRAAGAEGKVFEASSYLGIVALLFLVRGAVHGAPMGRRGFWWTALLCLILLASGVTVGLRESLPPIQWCHIPARFNLGVALVAAMIAASSLTAWLANRKSPLRRHLAMVLLWVLVIADGASIPLAPARPPAEPEARRWAFARQAAAGSIAGPAPGSSILELPTVEERSDALDGLQSLWSVGRGDRTSGGSTMLPDAAFDRAIGWTSPIRAERLADPHFPREGTVESFDVVRNVDLASYLWLYMKVHGFNQMVAHGRIAGRPAQSWELGPIRTQLSHAVVFDDGRDFVVTADRLRQPAAPVVLTGQGWLGRHSLAGQMGRRVAARAEVFACNPETPRLVRLAVEGASVRRSRTVRVVADGRVVSTWTVAARHPELYLTPPFELGPGVQRLTLESEGDETPKARAGDSKERFSLIVAALTLQWAGPADEVALRVGSEIVR